MNTVNSIHPNRPVRPVLAFAALALVVVAGCAEDEGRTGAADTDGGGIVPTESAGGTESGSGGVDTDPSMETDSATGSGGGGSNGDSDTQGNGPKFDVPDPGDTDGAEPGCSGDGGMETFSYIWIANTAEGTVSKIDTKTGVELGRYATGPNHPSGSPSRTSVNQYGDAVVVNRHPGGIAKVAALETSCVDSNANGMIETSTGPQDVLPWGEDECVLWYTDVPSPDLAGGPRPVAWEGVPLDENDCPTGVPRVWVAWRDGNQSGIVWRLDGSTGAIEDEVEIPNWGSGSQCPYGGAVNAAGDFWITGKAANSRAVRVDGVTLDWEDHHDAPASAIYGMAVDQHGNVWGGGSSASAAYRYDVAGDHWAVVDTPNVGRIRGIQIDRDGFAWGAGNNPCALVKIDTAALTLVDDQIALPGCNDPVGVSIDGDGFVWVVDRQADLAYKVDPDTHDVVLTVEGLNEPYTYSDMTGNGLNLVLDPPG